MVKVKHIGKAQKFLLKATTQCLSTGGASISPHSQSPMNPNLSHLPKHPSNSLPDECLALIFNFLTTTDDRNNSSLVSRDWLRIEAQTRTHLSLYATSELQPLIEKIFTRFNSLTHLVLCNNSKSVGINDDHMIRITSMCPNLTRLELRHCREITDSGVAAFSEKCNKLKEFSCVHCEFSDLGMFELLHNCTQLVALSVSLLYRSPDVRDLAKFRAGLAAKTLKVIELRHVDSERLFEPVISGSKNLRSLKLVWCGGKWDRSLEMIPDDSCLVEVHLERCNVTNVGLSSLSKCRDLISLRILDLNNLGWMNAGLVSVAKSCKGLKKLYVGFWNNMSKLGDEGLIAVGEHSMNLQELILIGVNATRVSLEVIATNCKNLVRLELSTSETITDVEMMCIAEKCVALKSLCIEECSVSNKGIEAFALGCPNLAKIRVTKCKKVTREVKDQLIASRGGQIECKL